MGGRISVRWKNRSWAESAVFFVPGAAYIIVTYSSAPSIPAQNNCSLRDTVSASKVFLTLNIHYQEDGGYTAQHQCKPLIS